MKSSLRILWVSSGFHLNTGYGKVAYNVVTRLKRLGYDIICFNPHISGGKLVLEGVLQLPRLRHPFGADVVPMYYRLYERNLLVTLWDVWVLDWIKGMNWLPYVPVDSDLDEYTYEINEQVNKPEAVGIIAMSRYGYEQLRKVTGKRIYLIPHGVDTKLYQPIPREKARRELGIPPDAFVFGTVQANIGDRKDIPCLIRAFRIFLDNNPDAHDALLLLWTNTQQVVGQSFDIQRLLKRYGVAKRTRIPRIQPPTIYYDEDFMPIVFNSMDWYVTASRGEGFGLPLLEAQACGRRVIAPNNSAQRELVGNRGILVKPKHRILTLTVPTHQEYPLVDPYDLADAMAKAYNKGGELCRECIEFASNYDWDRIIILWDKMFETIEVM